MDVVAFAKRLPQPGETVTGDRLEFFPGGKGANQAVASAKAGAATHMHGCVGEDDFGTQLIEFLSASGVGTASVSRVSGETSGTAIIVVDENGENNIVIIAGANAQVMAELSPSSGDVVVCQFEIPLNTVRAVLETAKASGATTILNPAPAMAFDALDLADYLVLNEGEAKALGVLRANPGQTIIVTHGKNGAVAIGKMDYSVKGRDVVPVDSTGAGDCFVGSLAARIALGDGLPQAMEFANAAAAISVTRTGAGPSMPGQAEVYDLLRT